MTLSNGYRGDMENMEKDIGLEAGESLKRMVGTELKKDMIWRV